MFKFHEMTPEELKNFNYGFAWRPIRFDESRCVEMVSKGGWGFKQCDRKCAHGPKKMYCKQHAKRYSEVSE